jgi:nucleoside-diphosphate-sugar epimerase
VNLVKIPRVSTTPKIALVAGANGMIGGYLIQALLEAPDYSRVFALTRRPYGREHPKLANRIVVYPRMAEQLKGMVAHDAFCCIGTTIAAAGSQEAFREADVDAVMLFARAARATGATRLVVVSSARADPASKNFYLRTKGEMEEEVASVGFPSLDILQPSLLLGPRKESRPMETLGRLLAPLANPFLTGSREALKAIPPKPWRGAWSAPRVVERVVFTATPIPPSSSSPKSVLTNPCRDNRPKRRLPDRGAAATVTRRAFARGFIP